MRTAAMSSFLTLSTLGFGAGLSRSFSVPFCGLRYSCRRRSVSVDISSPVSYLSLFDGILLTMLDYALGSAVPLGFMNYFLVGWFNGSLDKFYIQSWDGKLSVSLRRMR